MTLHLAVAVQKITRMGLILATEMKSEKKIREFSIL